ncbi:MAG: serine/threonine-protein kinase, partial [bacterium]|nr:serine/threonine-protein kinase [bacterium]
DKANEIARQICAGLAAAHDNGVLHRDLKPANIMIDGRGKARVTDFGVSVVAKEIQGAEAMSGTPAYMAPEQLTGKEVTQKSDIYSLGLVLYELFTGKRAYNSDNLLELMSMHEASSPTSPSSHVQHLDPLVESVTLRCLEKDPSKRPVSAIQVAAALPGGDPLAAALAAGETPSPEMVAASGEKTGLRPAIAMALLAAILVGLGLVALMSEKAGWKAQLLRQSSPETMKAKAQEMIRRLGYTEPPVDSSFGFQPDASFINWAVLNTSKTDRWTEFTSVQPAPIEFWYRQSPRYLESEMTRNFSKVTAADPGIASVSGMVNITMDPTGRLTWMIAVPPQVDPPGGEIPPKPDWAPLFAAAGLDPAAFVPTPSTWTPRVITDERAAWTGTYPGQPDIPIRIEAGSYRGLPVRFSVITPWTRPTLVQTQTITTGQTIANLILTGLFFIVLIGALVLARKSLRLGRGDRRGAARLAFFVFALILLDWVLGSDHAPTINLVPEFMFSAVGPALLGSGIVWLLYIGLEPYVRRRLPETIVSWNRTLAGNMSDPLVARDVSIGILLGTAFTFFSFLNESLRLWAGIVPGNFASTTSWLSVSEFASDGVLNSLSIAIFASLGYFFLLFLSYSVTRRRWLGGVVFCLILTLPAALDVDAPFVSALTVGLYWILAMVAYFRFGLLAVSVANSVLYIFYKMPMATDLTAWHSSYMLAAVALVIAAAAWAFHTSLAGQKLFTGNILDE